MIDSLVPVDIVDHIVEFLEVLLVLDGPLIDDELHGGKFVSLAFLVASSVLAPLPVVFLELEEHGGELFTNGDFKFVQLNLCDQADSLHIECTSCSVILFQVFGCGLGVIYQNVDGQIDKFEKLLP